MKRKFLKPIDKVLIEAHRELHTAYLHHYYHEEKSPNEKIERWRGRLAELYYAHQDIVKEMRSLEMLVLCKPLPSLSKESLYELFV